MKLINLNKIDLTLPSMILVVVQPDSIMDSVLIYQEEDYYGEVLEDSLYNLTPEVNEGEVCPDNWIFTYDLSISQSRQILPVVLQSGNGFKTFHDAALREEIYPYRVFSLRDLFYCKRECMDIFESEARHENLMETEDYRNFLLECEAPDSTLSRKGQNQKMKTARAVSIGKGVLLYDLDTLPGREAYKSFMQYCADHFFDNTLDELDWITISDVHCFFDQETYTSKLGAINLNFNHLGRDFRLSELNPDSLFNSEMVREGLKINQYRMYPLSTWFMDFIQDKNVRLPAYSTSLNIAMLDHIARKGYPQQPLASEIFTLCPYIGRFKDLETRILSAPQEEMPALQQQAMLRAQEILDTDFPHRRTLQHHARREEVDCIHTLEKKAQKGLRSNN